MKNIHLNKNGELQTVWNMEIVKLKDLVDKNTGEKIFNEEHQEHKFRFSDRNLEYMKDLWEEYKKLEKRYNEISTELFKRKYGDDIPVSNHFAHSNKQSSASKIDLFQTTDKPKLKIPIDEKALSERFVLAAEIEEVNQNVYVINKNVYRMHNETGELTINATLEDFMFSRPKEDDPPDILNTKIKENNEAEYFRLLNRIDEINRYSKSVSAGKISHYLDEVKFRFHEWYKNNNFKIPINRSNKKQKVKQIDRINELASDNNLTKGETVNSKIVNKILRILQKENLTKSNKPEAIRKQLQRLGYSKENTP